MSSVYRNRYQGSRGQVRGMIRSGPDRNMQVETLTAARLNALSTSFVNDNAITVDVINGPITSLAAAATEVSKQSGLAYIKLAAGTYTEAEETIFPSPASEMIMNDLQIVLEGDTRSVVGYGYMSEAFIPGDVSSPEPQMYVEPSPGPNNRTNDLGRGWVTLGVAGSVVTVSCLDLNSITGVSPNFATLGVTTSDQVLLFNNTSATTSQHTITNVAANALTLSPAPAAAIADPGSVLTILPNVTINGAIQLKGRARLFCRGVHISTPNAFGEEQATVFCRPEDPGVLQMQNCTMIHTTVTQRTFSINGASGARHLLSNCTVFGQFVADACQLALTDVTICHRISGSEPTLREGSLVNAIDLRVSGGSDGSEETLNVRRGARLYVLRLSVIESPVAAAGNAALDIRNDARVIINGQTEAPVAPAADQLFLRATDQVRSIAATKSGAVIGVSQGSNLEVISNLTVRQNDTAGGTNNATLIAADRLSNASLTEASLLLIREDGVGADLRADTSSIIVFDHGSTTYYQSDGTTNLAGSERFFADGTGPQNNASLPIQSDLGVSEIAIQSV